MAMQFTKCTVRSEKFQKDFSVETYETNGIIVISATSLKRVYEEIKASEGITDSIISDVRNDVNGHIFYASVELTLKDKKGYCSTSIGEATLDSLTTPIARMYPKITAYNRALAAAVISYLQLPGKYYSEYSFNIDNNNVTNTENVTNIKDVENVKSVEKVKSEENAKNAESVENEKDVKNNEFISEEVKTSVIETTIKETPEMPIEAIQEDASTTIEETSIKEMENQLPFNDGPTAMLKNENTVVPESNIPNTPAPEIKAQPTVTPAAATTITETPKINTAISENQYVGIGKYSQTTIADFRQMIDNGDAVANKMLTVIKTGRVTDNAHKAVIDYIKSTF